MSKKKPRLIPRLTYTELVTEKARREQERTEQRDEIETNMHEELLDGQNKLQMLMDDLATQITLLPAQRPPNLFSITSFLLGGARGGACMGVFSSVYYGTGGSL